MVASDRNRPRGWVLIAPRTDAYRLAVLRGESATEICEQGDKLWVRGQSPPPDDPTLAAILPGALAAWLLEGDWVLPLGKHIPLGKLPSGDWQRLNDWLQLRLPVAITTVARPPEPLELRLARSTDERRAAILKAGLSEWAAYVETVARWRLERWGFVANRQGQILVRGLPLPSLPGQAYWEQDGIVLPLGWNWQPALAPPVVRELLMLAPGEVGVVDRRDDGEGGWQWQRIAAEQWVRVTRAAARAAKEAVLGT